MKSMTKLLNDVKKLNQRTKVLVEASTALYGDENIDLLTKESLSVFPIQTEILDWSQSFELGNNILGIRIPSDNTIRFILRAVDDGEYSTHYHDCQERVEVLNKLGEIIFIINNVETILNIDNPIIKVEKNIHHSVFVKKGTSFQVDFK